MNDTPGRKNPARFVPPPWEKEQFEELAEKKVAEEGRAALEQQAQQVQIEAKRKVEEDAGSRPEEITKEPAEKDGDGKTDTDMAQMMAILKAEEPSAGKGLWKAGAAAGVFMALLGVIFMVWGTVALRATQDTGSAGRLGAGILIIFGIGFIVLAAWTIHRSLRQRGAS